MKIPQIDSMIKEDNFELHEFNLELYWLEVGLLIAYQNSPNPAESKLE